MLCVFWCWWRWYRYMQFCYIYSRYYLNLDSLCFLMITVDRVLHHFREKRCLLGSNNGRALMSMDTNMMQFLEMQWHFYYLLTFRYKMTSDNIKKKKSSCLYAPSSWATALVQQLIYCCTPRLYGVDEGVKSLQCHGRTAAGLLACRSMRAVLRWLTLPSKVFMSVRAECRKHKFWVGCKQQSESLYHLQLKKILTYTSRTHHNQ